MGLFGNELRTLKKSPYWMIPQFNVLLEIRTIAQTWVIQDDTTQQCDQSNCECLLKK